MVVAVDRRIERTRAQLRNAVMELIEQGDRAEITVQEVTRRARVNRATFYQHYRDKDELIERTIGELVDEVYDACSPVLAGIDRFRPDLVHPSVVHALLKIGERPALFARLIGPGGDPTFNRIFSERTVALGLQALSVQCADEPSNAVPQAIRARASTGMFISICSYWLETGCVEPVESVADWYWRLTHPVWFPE
ncbi:MAG: TetR/AcrR family transcriptional regulator [Thermomicrobiales bacterium]|nr:TetR/AcrR family transcriptional regulator [Thermomicrobiales bacterium]